MLKLLKRSHWPAFEVLHRIIRISSSNGGSSWPRTDIVPDSFRTLSTMVAVIVEKSILKSSSFVHGRRVSNLMCFSLKIFLKKIML